MARRRERAGGPEALGKDPVVGVRAAEIRRLHVASVFLAKNYRHIRSSPPQLRLGEYSDIA